MANFLTDKSFSISTSALRKAVLVWLIPLFITSFLFSLNGQVTAAFAAFSALISLSPVLGVYLWVGSWMSLKAWMRYFAAFGLGALRLTIVDNFSGSFLLKPIDLAVAGTFSLFWWILVERLLIEHNLIARKFSAIAQMGKLELSNRIYSNLTVRNTENLVFQKAPSKIPLEEESQNQLAENLAIISIEREISLVAKSVGGFQAISSMELPKLQLLETLRDSLRKPSFDLRFALLGYSSLIAAGAVSNYSPERAILTTLSTTAVFGLLLMLGNARKLRERASTWLTILLFACIAAFPVILPDLLLMALGYSSELGNWEVSVGTPLTLISVAIGSTVLSHLRSARRKLAEDLATRLAAQDVLAIYLHNSLKSEFGGLLAQLAAAKTEQEKKRLWDAITHRIRGDLMGEALRSEEFPRKRLEEVLDAWSPIVQIDAISLLESSASESGLVCRLVEEAVANAARHSGATEIKLSVKADPNMWTLDIQANGTIQTRSGSGGLGLRLLELVAESWSLKLSPGSQKLTIRLLR